MKCGILSGLGLGLCLLFSGNVTAQTNSPADTAMLKNSGDVKSADSVHQSNVFNQKADVANPVSVNRTIAPDQNTASKNIIPLIQQTSHDTNIVYRPIGEGAVNIGQINSGYYKFPGQSIAPISHVWQQWAYSILGVDMQYKKNLDINISGRGLVAFSTPQIGGEPQTMQTRDFFYIKTANASYTFLNNEMFALQLQAGYFPFKYNPDVRNLGEYLFRSNAYPLLVYSEFDYPEADILGLHVNFQFQTPDKLLYLQNDLLFHSELYSVPVQDWSLSDVLSAKFFDAVTIGGGFSLCNWFSVYQGKYGANWADQFYYPNSLTAGGAFYLKNSAGTDSALFDWKSTKVMARASFDIKKLVPSPVFGKNDFVLYGEADFIGLKNYPEYYTDLKDRTFYSAGFNVPCCKLLDVFNVETEYCPDTSAFSDEKLFVGTTPSIAPTYLNSSTSTINVKRNPWRLSFYAKKTILDGRVSFVAQCARDHNKIDFYYFDVSKMSLMETLPSSNSWWLFNGNWWWVFKTEFNF